jgi:hypothetical protein
VLRDGFDVSLEGRESGRECQIVIKTTADSLPAPGARARAASAEVPEFLVLSIAAEARRISAGFGVHGKERMISFAQPYMNGRAWLITTWTGRSFLAAIVLKGLVLVALWRPAAPWPSNTPTASSTWRSSCWPSSRSWRVARGPARLLWRVRRKLILSYILIGAVPILLLLAFSCSAFAGVLRHQSYWLKTLSSLIDQANTLANHADRGGAHAVGGGRRSSPGVKGAGNAFPGVSVAMVGRRESTLRRAGVEGSANSRCAGFVAALGELPRVLRHAAVSGRVRPSGRRISWRARRAAQPRQSGLRGDRRFASDETSTAQALEGTGIDWAHSAWCPATAVQPR